MALNNIGSHPQTYQPPVAAQTPSSSIASATNIMPGQGASLDQSLGFNPPQGGSQQIMLQLMQLMLQMLQLVISLLGGQSQEAQLSRALPGNDNTTPAVGSSGNTHKTSTKAASPSEAPPSNEDTGNDSELQNSLDAIAADPEGQALLEKAESEGISIRVGETGASNILGLFQQRGDQKWITVRDGGNVKTIVHELVHAVSHEDGNSQHEEGIANVVGDRIASRIEGREAQDADQLYNKTLPLYQDLQQHNNIEQTLSELGIST